MVTAAGEIVLASADSHPDLFWAARGAGAGLLRRRDRLPPPAASAAADGLRLARDPSPRRARLRWPTGSPPRPPRRPRTTEIGCFLLAHWDTGEQAIDPARLGLRRERGRRARKGRVVLLAAGRASSRSARSKERSPAVHRAVQAVADARRASASPPITCGATRRSATCCWRCTTLPAPSPDSTIDIVAFGGHTPVALPATPRCPSAAAPASASTGCGTIPPTTRPTAPGSAGSTRRSPRSAPAATSARPT